MPPRARFRLAIIINQSGPGVYPERSGRVAATPLSGEPPAEGAEDAVALSTWPWGWVVAMP
ncbi:MAG: hypothetical protein PHC78_07150, partial [Verrucomicrobiota bacterium]|nr:hypothetical protein [Verrucomicrobiota bacterium]